MLATLGSGQESTEIAARCGGTASRTSYRAYAKADRTENSRRSNGQALRDGSHRQQAGFRADWAGNTDKVTLQGDSYQDTGEQPQVLDGLNVLARWSRDPGNESALTLRPTTTRRRASSRCSRRHCGDAL